MRDYKNKARCVHLVASVLMTVAGCGASQAAPEATTTGAMRQRVQAVDMVSLLPADTVGVVRMDAAPLRQHGWMQDLVGVAMAERPGGGAVVRDFFERTDEIIVGLQEVRDGTTGPKVVLMRGRYGPADMVAGPGSVAGTYRAHAVNERTSDGWLTTLLEDHTAISGDAGMVHAVLDAVDRLVPARGPQSELYRDGEARLGLRSHDIVWLAEMRGVMAPSSNAMTNATQLLAMWMDAGEQLEAGGVITFSDPSVPPLIERAIALGLQQVATDPALAEAGLVACLEQLEVGVEDDELRAHISLDAEQTASLARFLEGYIEGAR